MPSKNHREAQDTSDIQLSLWRRLERYINLNNAMSAACVTILGFLVNDILFERWDAAKETLVLLAGVLVLTVVVRGIFLAILLRNRKDYRLTRIFNSQIALIEQEILRFLAQEMQEEIAKVGDMLMVRQTSDSLLLAKLRGWSEKMKVDIGLEEEPL